MTRRFLTFDFAPTVLMFFWAVEQMVVCACLIYEVWNTARSYMNRLRKTTSVNLLSNHPFDYWRFSSSIKPCEHESDDCPTDHVTCSPIAQISRYVPKLDKGAISNWFQLPPMTLIYLLRSHKTRTASGFWTFGSLAKRSLSFEDMLRQLIA